MRMSLRKMNEEVGEGAAPEAGEMEGKEIVKELQAYVDRLQHLKELVKNSVAEIKRLRKRFKEKIEELKGTRLCHEWWYILSDLLETISGTEARRGRGELLSDDLDIIANLDLFYDLYDIFMQLMSLRLCDDCTVTVKADDVYIHIAIEGIDFHPPGSKREFIKNLIKYANVIAPHLREPIREAFLELTALAKDFKFLDEFEIVRKGSFRAWFGEEPEIFNEIRLHPLAIYSIELSKADMTYTFGVGEAEHLFELYDTINEMYREWAAKVLEIRKHNEEIIKKMKNVLAVYILSEKL